MDYIAAHYLKRHGITLIFKIKLSFYSVKAFMLTTQIFDGYLAHGKL